MKKILRSLMSLLFCIAFVSSVYSIYINAEALNIYHVIIATTFLYFAIDYGAKKD
jgi:hypothetical protein